MPRPGFYSALIGVLKPVRLIVLFVVGCFTSLLLWLSLKRVRPHCPHYQGHSLSWWLHEVPQFVSPADSVESYQAKREASRKAIQAMGTNAIPCLLFWHQSPDHPKL